MQLGRILITGGAGYIGSHVVKALYEAKAEAIIVIDNLSSGFAQNIIGAKFIQGDVQDISLVSQILKTEKIDTVMHFAAATRIPESIENPLAYYQNNTVGTLHLLQACTQNAVKNFIFSSTAAVYAADPRHAVDEKSPTIPTNPYGYSKLMSEQIIQDTAAAHPNMHYVILRYFNVAGADPSGVIGQRTPLATHLIKAATQTACGLQPALPIYGDDYPTPDGTCIRDFIHVSDLAKAHLCALDYLQQGGNSVTLNCGYGRGYSVKEVVKAVEHIQQAPLPTFVAPRRPGDIPKVIADNKRILELFDWHPEYNDLDFIVKTALDFEKKLL